MNPWLCNLLFNNSGGSSLPATGQTFYASLKTSMVPEVGTGGPTWSRATTAWRFNDMGYLRQIPSGCAEFGGARLVTNTVRTKSEDFNNSAWTKTSLTTPSANTVLCANATSPQNMSQSGVYPPVVTGESFIYGVRAQYVADGVTHLQLSANGTGFGSSQYLNVSLADGSFNAVGCTGSVTLVSPGVYDISIKCVVTATGNYDSFTIGLANGLSDTRFQAFVGDGVKSLTLLRSWSVNTTGRDASYVPEYVSVGSTAGKNFFLHTDDFSQSAWSKTNVTLTQAATANPINGLVNAQKVEVTANGSTTLLQDASSIGSSAGNILVIHVKQGSGATDANLFYIRNLTTATNLLGISFNFSTGDINYITGSTGVSATALQNGWWKLQMVVTSGISSGDNLRCYIGFNGSSETAGEHLYAYRPYFGQGTTAPDVIPVVAGSWDAHGAGVDGSKYFATDWQGASIPVANLTRLRKESSATNALLWSRDLSNAAWSTKTNITAAKTATGLDGIANTATTLTATSTDAIILQPTSGIASAARCASAYVRRKTGTGTISFTQDGGSTWTDITSQINAATYVRTQITSTLANPSVGFKISTSGDAINVDCVQNEAGSVATSPIVTTTTTVNRNADVLTYQTSGNIDFTVGTCYSILKSSGALTSRFAVYLPNGSSFVNSSNENTSWSSYDGVNTVSKTGLDDMTVEAMVKRVVAWGGSTQKVTGNGATPASGVFDGSWGSGATISIGNTVQGYVGDVAIYNYKMTDAELQAITT